MHCCGSGRYYRTQKKPKSAEMNALLILKTTKSSNVRQELSLANTELVFQNEQKKSVQQS
jgi:hypothetical protein